MEQQKVKVYGIVSLTKSVYIRIQVLVFLVLLAALVISLLWEVPDNLRGNFLFANLALIVIIIAVLELLETFFTLKKFQYRE